MHFNWPAAGLAILCLAIPLNAVAKPCQPTNAANIQAALSIGDVYNALASDGDELPGAYFAKVTVKRGVYAYTIQTHHSEYNTTHEGAEVYTVVRTIDGRTVSLPWFAAQDETAEFRIERCLGFLGLYGGIGVARTSANYAYPLGYKHSLGLGAGVERFPGQGRDLDFFTALYYYPAATAAYGNEKLSLTIVTFDGGLRMRTSPQISTFVGLYQEIRFVHPWRRAGQTIRAAPYIGFALGL